MKGIPTEYDGVRFRSRVEATWAAYFDALSFGWLYEPVDMRGYIPDFLLTVPGRKNGNKQIIYAEVKGAAASRDELREAMPKIESAGLDRDLLLLGMAPSAGAWFFKHQHNSWREAGIGGEYNSFWYMEDTPNSMRMDFEPAAGWWNYGEEIRAPLDEWRAAQNKTQWRAT